MTVLGVFWFCPSHLEVCSILLQLFRIPVSKIYFQLFIRWARLFYFFSQTAVYHIPNLMCSFKVMSYLRSVHLPLIFHDQSTASNPNLGTDYPYLSILSLPPKDSYILPTSVSFHVRIISTLHIKFKFYNFNFETNCREKRTFSMPNNFLWLCLIKKLILNVYRIMYREV